MQTIPEPTEFKRLVHHKRNGAVCLRTYVTRDNGRVDQVSSEIVVRFVYADEELEAALVESVRVTLRSRGIEV